MSCGETNSTKSHLFENAERLVQLEALDILENNDLEPSRLARIMENSLSNTTISTHKIDLEGAFNTASWIESSLESQEISR